VSFNGGQSGSYVVVGTKGTLELKPAYTYDSDMEMTITVEGKQEKRTFKKGQQFGAEIEYFARCILENKEVEPDGLEGLADIRVVNAIKKSAELGGTPVETEPVAKGLRPGADQVIKMPPKSDKDLVDAASPGE